MEFTISLEKEQSHTSRVFLPFTTTNDFTAKYFISKILNLKILPTAENPVGD